MIPYGKHLITEEDISSVVSILRSDYLTQGPAVELFEKRFADYVGAKYAIAVSNGTAALHLINLAINTSSKDIFLTTPISFAATSNAILFCNGHIEFSDIDINTILIDLVELELKIKSKPIGYYKAIVFVNMAGYPLDTQKLYELSKKYGIWLIEDSCHSLGAYYYDKENSEVKSGSCKHSDFSIFSFHPVKHIATGEGGMITTNSEEMYEKIKVLRSHGIVRDSSLFKSKKDTDGGWYYEMHNLGFNYRLSDINAALGISQLSRIEHKIARRKEIARRYINAFENKKNIRLFSNRKDSGHSYHLFIIGVNNRKELYDYLKLNGVQSQIHYIPIYNMPFYRDNVVGYDFSLKNAENYYSQCLSLPMYESLTFDEVDYIIDLVIKFISI
ncbi:MAG: UDP-4-amino-4,6-dideoxy-N-acetyl-beta-L-altrosamine transaminase [Flavobacterium sp.]|jgi:UDP-4-amino-4,6-dideoxy-N-acetyl-beta-L-altrosamine transaminase|nr:UDP-4-amino-4,6-dideoxy-N-acetyl-beta-L-altrosamine transaminase [Flavobacterium sp.]